MPANSANAKHFLLSSDYPIDKIVGSYASSIAVAAGDSSLFTVAHGLPFTPLPIIKWSLSPDFSTSYDETGASPVRDHYLFGQTDGTNLYIVVGNYTASSATIYYRVIYFMPSDSTATALPTAASFDNFMLNTGYNYTKIIAEGTLPGGTQVVTHSLGYYPQAEVWYKRTSNGRITHLVENDVTPFVIIPSCQMTTTAMTLTENSIPVTNYYYRIYADET